jgi:hydroxymethylglutaryl-CoA reductase
MTDPKISSRIPRFYEQPIDKRLELLLESGVFSEESRTHLARGGALDPALADRMSENVIATHGLPLSVALNFRVNGRDVLVPMAVEEPSVVAAASNAARLVRVSGGFFGEATPSIMTAQIQLDEVDDCDAVGRAIALNKEALLARGNRAIPNMVERGCGCRDLETRVIDRESGLVVVHVYVDVGDAMGANLVDAVAEALAEPIAELANGRIGLRILSNLPLNRMVKVRARLSVDALGGADAASAIARASRFAELDPFRAVTHNKGIMNGVDAVAVALGQDWRSIEAGAHGYAAISGKYSPLATWKRFGDELEGVLEMPLAVATKGGSTRAHPGISAAFELVRVESARELAVIVAAAGLASNLAALRALAGEGIQRGHMKLHKRKEEIRDERSENGARLGSDVRSNRRALRSPE